MSARGCRKSRELTIETYGNADELIDGNLKKDDVVKKPNSKSSKKKNKLKKEESTINKTEEINFISGNPFVEVTKGVLHVYKEK